MLWDYKLMWSKSSIVTIKINDVGHTIENFGIELSFSCHAHHPASCFVRQLFIGVSLCLPCDRLPPIHQKESRGSQGRRSACISELSWHYYFFRYNICSNFNYYGITEFQSLLAKSSLTLYIFWTTGMLLIFIQWIRFFSLVKHCLFNPEL